MCRSLELIFSVPSKSTIKDNLCWSKKDSASLLVRSLPSTGNTFQGRGGRLCERGGVDVLSDRHGGRIITTKAVWLASLEGTRLYLHVVVATSRTTAGGPSSIVTTVVLPVAEILRLCAQETSPRSVQPKQLRGM